MHVIRIFQVAAVVLAIWLPAGSLAINSTIPSGFSEIWSDEFTKMSLRTGGPTFDGLERGSGTWTSPGAWYSSDPRGVPGYGGYDWFVDPSYGGWPNGYSGELAITDGGLRLRAEPPRPAVSMVLQALATNAEGSHWQPWLSGQVNSYYAVRIRPPFYFEVRARMPQAGGRPFSSIWLNTWARRSTSDHGMNYEIDVQEGFGDSDRLHAGIHWDKSPLTHKYGTRTAADRPAGSDLSLDFHTWGCEVRKELQIFYFEGSEIGRVATPARANIDQPFGILLDVSAGIPWKGGGPPSGGPHDMIVRYVRLYAADSRGLTLQSP